ncbi:phosphomethylpyrimidine kinase [Neoconidiobolus thromboides FSU 785]|nr:phosphomethylpyrimidine kinase [Neoconidiobolus thromboides FSU 785]
MSKEIVKVLTIAGSDSGGGAGIQADLKTYTSLKVYGVSVITALTAQNTLGVTDIMEVPCDFIEKQFDTVLSDIPISVAKIGMLSSKEVILTVSNKLKKYNIKKIVLDPVMVSTSGSKLLREDSIATLIQTLIPQSYLITPNLDEAKLLTSLDISSIESMEQCCKKLYEMGPKYVLLKGGHLPLDKELKHCAIENSEIIIDLFYDGKEFTRIEHPYIHTQNTHGSGCTLSSAISSYLSHGYNVLEAVKKGISFTHNGIKESFSVGKGAGPLNHFHSKIDI